jgi:tripartite-type tricarboxylate transporter receptor subunit TctC
MSTISTATRTLSQSPQDRKRQIAQVQAALERLVNDPDAVMLARLQHILNVSEQDAVVRQHLHDAITQLNRQVRELGHRVIE